MPPIDPASTAAEIGRRFGHTEPKMDPRNARSGRTAREGELLDECRKRGVRPDAYGRGLERAIALAPDGPAQQVVYEIAAGHPEFFEAAPSSNVDALIAQHNSGHANVTPGS